MHKLLFFAAALFLAPAFASAATLELWSERATVRAGETVVVRLLVESDQPLNAVEGLVSFPADLLSVTSISKTGSVVALWVEEPSYSNAQGTVSFSGGVPNPGYMGDFRRVINIEFRAKAAGSATIAIQNASVLANDGAGTNILTQRTPATLTISEGAASASQEESAAEESEPAASPEPIAFAPEAEAKEGFAWLEELKSLSVPAYAFLGYVVLSLLVILGLVLYYMVGLRIKIYRVRPTVSIVSGTPKRSRVAEK